MKTWNRSVATALVVLAVVGGVTSGRWTAPEGPADNAGVTAKRGNPGIWLRTHESGGVAVRWALYVPADVKGPLPLVVFLHGRGECGTDGMKQMAVGIGPAFVWNKDRWPCAILMPQKPTYDAAWSDHADAVMAMIEEAKGMAEIDPARIALTGLSQGGCGTWEIAARFPGKFCAIAPVCGYGDPAKIAAGLGDVPVWAFHGEKDNVVPPARTKAIVEAVKAKGGDVKLTLYPEANHNSWDAAYGDPELAAWLLARR